LWAALGKVTFELLGAQQRINEQDQQISSLTEAMSEHADLAASVERHDEETAMLQDRMYRDRRTGLKNIAFLEDRILPKLEAKLDNYRHLPEELRAKAPIHALFFVDMNGLKQINEFEGYQAGNAAIEQFTSRLVKAVRDTDIVIRWGGDEVIIISELLPDEYADTTKILPRRIAVKLAEFDLDPTKGERAITAAVGFGKIEDYASVEAAIAAISEEMKVNKRLQKSVVDRSKW
jgi:diguanylate cyclase (GGDEF)-like protein